MGILDKFKIGFQKSASAFTSGLKDIIVKKEINDEIVTKGPLTPIRLAFDPTNDNRFAVVDVSNGTIGLDQHMSTSEESIEVIEGNKKLIEIYTQKIQNRINIIWGED